MEVSHTPCSQLYGRSEAYLFLTWSMEKLRQIVMHQLFQCANNPLDIRMPFLARSYQPQFRDPTAISKLICGLYGLTWTMEKLLRDSYREQVEIFACKHQPPVRALSYQTRLKASWRMINPRLSPRGTPGQRKQNAKLKKGVSKDWVL